MATQRMKRAATRPAVDALAPTTAGAKDAENRASLCGLPNLGPRSRQMLQGAGIESVEQLRALGAVSAYAQVRRSGARPSLNLLWALEGALTGLPWQAVAREHRTSLLLALDALERRARPS